VQAFKIVNTLWRVETTSKLDADEQVDQCFYKLKPKFFQKVTTWGIAE
jgi:hypothetical protein